MYESELEAMAAKALGLTEYDENIAKEQLESIIIDNAEVLFLLKKKEKRIPRSYGRYSGFSGKLICGECGEVLIRDDDHHRKVWICSEGYKRKLTDEMIQKAAKDILGDINTEGIFARDIKEAINYFDRIEFHFKEGRVETWQKE